MGWKDLLKTKQPNKEIVFPWCGGRDMITSARCWKIDGDLPQEHGWYKFGVSGRKATLIEQADDQSDLEEQHVGYLVGDRFVPDYIGYSPDIKSLTKEFKRVNILEPGLDKFARIRVGKTWMEGPTVFISEEFPLGPEDDVLEAFLNGEQSVEHISEVSPALDCSFRYEIFRKEMAEKRREEERILREEEERKRRIRDSIKDGASRRELAVEDFGAAAKSALLVGGATYLDHRESSNIDEMIVRFRFMNQRFECTCNRYTLRIIDSGICLQDEWTGEKGDDRFTLESLTSAIAEAINDNKLVKYRY
jgi:hypothetical protein